MALSPRKDSFETREQKNALAEDRPKTVPGGRDKRFRWDDSVRAGTIMSVRESVEPGRSTSFSTKFFGYGFLEDIVPNIISIIICIILLYVLYLIGPRIIGDTFAVSLRVLLPYILIPLLVIAGLGGIMGTSGGAFGLFGSLATKLARIPLKFILAIPGAITKAIRRPLHDIIVALRGNSDRDLTVYTYLLKRFDDDTGQLGRPARRGSSTPAGVDQCIVRVRGVHKGVIPAADDQVTFEGSVNPKTKIFEATGGAIEPGGERIDVWLPRWAR